jgi:hypothetical protein
MRTAKLVAVVPNPARSARGREVLKVIGTLPVIPPYDDRGGIYSVTGFPVTCFAAEDYPGRLRSQLLAYVFMSSLWHEYEHCGSYARKHLAAFSAACI